MDAAKSESADERRSDIEAITVTLIERRATTRHIVPLIDDGSSAVMGEDRRSSKTCDASADNNYVVGIRLR